MSDPFATALAALFSAAGAVAAEYEVADTGDILEISVIWSQGTDDGGTRRDRLAVDVNTFDVQRTDVLFPARGDMITVADRVTGDILTFKINGAAVLDVEGVTWTCPTEPVDAD
ncbi:hypothetical protein [uncultured Sphingomonas sp.]|uniref:head-tail joining protein n=1 Tax=uncultured Sphingomonas sp. TaxID=158754 RepID=UPI0026157012|nr:hypothetical protein [uncultured Sphingomonas sp.]